jgi:hypothetical protein
MKLITIVYDDVRLLPRFLRFYADQGVDHFLFGIYSCRNMMDEVRRLSAGHKITIREIDGEYSGEKDTQVRIELQQQFIGRNEWWVVADVDEFHEYPEPLPQLVPKLGRCNHVRARFLDRVADDGRFPPLREGSMWEQFPYGLQLTGNLLRAQTHKVMLVKGATLTGPGHHFIHGRTNPYPEPGVVHHFKWFDGAEQRFMRRRDAYLAAGVPWHTECSRFLDYYESHGRIVVDDPLFEPVKPAKPRHWPDV